MKAILIDVSTRQIREVEYSGLRDLQKMVGGYIEAARRFDTGDVLFVDEEGKLKPQANAFRLDGVNDLLCGNGVVVGPEIGDTANTKPPTISTATLRALVTWVAL